ncbi:MAG: PAS domain S-box protein [Opitutae bacterium]|nr:PAS domain S-box protein [Opitutae bacterium]
MIRTKLAGPLQLTFTYAVLAGVWIVASDVLVAWWHGGPTGALTVNVTKGLIFVGISSAVLYRLAGSMAGRVRAIEQERTRIADETALALRRANRLYATLARANEVALTAVDRTELCRAICQTLIDHAGMRLAWIGWVDETTQAVRLEASSGPATAYAAGLSITVDATRAESRGPAGQSIRSGKVIVCQDIAHTASMIPWQTAAAAHALRSCLAVPLRVQGGTRGTLMIYSDEVAFFTREIVELVEKLAADLTHGIEVLQVRQRYEEQTAALRESEQRWQFALEGAGDGVWDRNIATGDAFLSPRLVAMFGYQSTELHGHVDEWVAHLHPEDAARVQAAYDECLAGGADSCRVEYRLRCKDGSYRWVLDRGKIIERDAAGRPKRMIGTLADLSELRRTHERLVLLEAALQATPAGILITDASGRIEWVNEGFTQLTGYSLAEAVGQNPRLLKSSRQTPEFYAKLWQTIQRGEVWSGDIVNRRKGDGEYHEHMIIAPVSHGGDGTTHFIAIKQDITERRQLEQQFLRAQRMEGIGLLAGGIAHDLNNVLAPILLSVELLRLRSHDSGDKRTLEVIESAARRGTGIVRQVLTFARGIDGERSPVRPRDLIRELVLMIEETFPRDIEIRRDVADDTPMVSGDATQLHQVLLNLAVNARDAMPNGGALLFAARPVAVGTKCPSYMGEIAPGDYVMLSVRDTGQGMTLDVRERIFDPFFTTKPRGKGTGLGLPTVHGIVRSHGGFIQVDSEPGAGSEFRVYLPALPPEATEREAPVAPRKIDGRGRTVLVCDDEPAVREIAGVVLRQAGFEVVEAGNGREALDLFNAHSGPIHAALMDIMMPLMTGDRAAAEMLQANPKLPLIFMSGLMDQEAVRVALDNVGARPPPLLKKPFTAQDLLGAMARALETAHAGGSAPSA